MEGYLMKNFIIVAITVLLVKLMCPYNLLAASQKNTRKRKQTDKHPTQESGKKQKKAPQKKSLESHNISISDVSNIEHETFFLKTPENKELINVTHKLYSSIKP